MEELEIRIEEYREEELKPLKEIKYVSYGYCVGFLNDDGYPVTKPHKYFDGKKHIERSGELCKDCYVLFKKISKINKIEL